MNVGDTVRVVGTRHSTMPGRPSHVGRVGVVSGFDVPLFSTLGDDGFVEVQFPDEEEPRVSWDFDENELEVVNE